MTSTSRKTTSLHSRPTGRRPWEFAGNGISGKWLSEETCSFSRAAQTLDVLLAVRDMLVSAADHDIHVTLAEGNHDKVNQESLRGYCHVFDRHPNVTVVDEYLTLCRPEWKFALHVMSYFPEDGSFAERLGRLAAEALSGEPEHFLYIHEGINGALAQPSEKELPARIFSPFDKVFVGHYHNRTVIPGTGIEYIGSSRQHNFGEDEEKGYTVLYTDARTSLSRTA